MEPSLLLIPALLGSGAVATGFARRHQASKDGGNGAVHSKSSPA
jgi:hypothetical protein